MAVCLLATVCDNEDGSLICLHPGEEKNRHGEKKLVMANKVLAVFVTRHLKWIYSLHPFKDAGL